MLEKKILVSLYQGLSTARLKQLGRLSFLAIVLFCVPFLVQTQGETAEDPERTKAAEEVEQQANLVQLLAGTEKLRLGIPRDKFLRYLDELFVISGIEVTSDSFLSAKTSQLFLNKAKAKAVLQAKRVASVIGTLGSVVARKEDVEIFPVASLALVVSFATAGEADETLVTVSYEITREILRVLRNSDWEVKETIPVGLGAIVEAMYSHEVVPEGVTSDGVGSGRRAAAITGAGAAGAAAAGGLLLRNEMVLDAIKSESRDLVGSLKKLASKVKGTAKEFKKEGSVDVGKIVELSASKAYERMGKTDTNDLYKLGDATGNAVAKLGLGKKREKQKKKEVVPTEGNGNASEIIHNVFAGIDDANPEDRQTLLKAIGYGMHFKHPEVLVKLYESGKVRAFVEQGIQSKFGAWGWGLHGIGTFFKDVPMTLRGTRGGLSRVVEFGKSMAKIFS